LWLECSARQRKVPTSVTGVAWSLLEEIGAHLARVGVVGRREVAVGEGAAGTFRDARMAARAVFGEDRAATGDGTFAEFLVEIGGEVGRRVGRLALVGARGGEVGLVGFGRGEEVEDGLQAVLDRPEIRAIAPALADVERRLAEAALLGVDLAHVGEMVDPALFGARADVEIDALDGF
jgi:hypothetical protein